MIFSRFAFLIALVTTALFGAEVAKPPVDAIAEPLVKSIAEISSKEDPTAKDYARMADSTVNFARRKTQASEPFSRNVIESGLDAVDAGESRNAKAANWPKLREELKAFLEEKDKEKPPPQDQDQNKQDPSGDGEKNPQDQSSQKSSSDSQKKRDSSSKETDQKNDANGSPEKSSNSSKQDQETGKPKDRNSEQPPKDPASAFGDMNEKRPPPPPGSPQATPDDTQKVGGQPKGGSAQTVTVDPQLAVPLQKLDQLKQQDSPAKLFRLMEGLRAASPAKKGKDW